MPYLARSGSWYTREVTASGPSSSIPSISMAAGDELLVAGSTSRGLSGSLISCGSSGVPKLEVESSFAVMVVDFQVTYEILSAPSSEALYCTSQESSASTFGSDESGRGPLKSKKLIPRRDEPILIWQYSQDAFWELKIVIRYWGINTGSLGWGFGPGGLFSCRWGIFWFAEEK